MCHRPGWPKYFQWASQWRSCGSAITRCSVVRLSMSDVRCSDVRCQPCYHEIRCPVSDVFDVRWYIIFSMFSDLMPIPVSSTIRVIAFWLSIWISSLMVPFDGVNLTALDTRLMTTCLIWRGTERRRSWSLKGQVIVCGHSIFIPPPKLGSHECVGSNSRRVFDILVGWKYKV